MGSQKVITVSDSLAENYHKLDPYSIQYASELMNDRRDDENLRNQKFWTADSVTYQVKNDEVLIHLAKRENNLIFKNLTKAIHQITNTGYFIPSKESLDTVIESETTLHFKSSELGLKEYEQDSTYAYVGIDTSMYNLTLNQYGRILAERLFGEGKDFKKNMLLLQENGISQTKIFFPSPKIIKDLLGNEGVMTFLCGLNSFDMNSNVTASSSDVNCPDIHIRGERLSFLRKVKLFLSF